MPAAQIDHVRHADMQDALDDAFEQLERRGYFAIQRLACCQSCGWGAVPEEEERVVFYHDQDYMSAQEGHGLYLAWGHARTVAIEVCAIFRDVGFTCTWDGSEKTRIKVEHPHLKMPPPTPIFSSDDEDALGGEAPDM